MTLPTPTPCPLWKWQSGTLAATCRRMPVDAAPLAGQQRQRQRQWLQRLQQFLLLWLPPTLQPVSAALPTRTRTRTRIWTRTRPLTPSTCSHHRRCGAATACSPPNLLKPRRRPPCHPRHPPPLSRPKRLCRRKVAYRWELWPPGHAPGTAGQHAALCAVDTPGFCCPVTGLYSWPHSFPPH